MDVMDRTSDIIKKINHMSGSKSVYMVFEDFIHILAITYFNWLSKDTEKEKEFVNVMKDYKEQDMLELWMMLNETAECKMIDILGDIYMKLGAGSKNLGQFFTPYQVSQAVAGTAFEEKLMEQPYITFNEPSCGAGGMVIAYGEILKSKDFNYQNRFRVTAQDLSLNSFYMCFVQLSMYGFDAKVILGDTLTNERRMVWYTPVHYFNGDLWR